MVTQRMKHKQKWGVKFLKAQRTGWSVTTINQPPGELRKTGSDLRSDKALANVQLAHPAGPAWAGPHPSESRDMGLQSMVIYLSLEYPGVCSSVGRRKHTPMFSKE